MPHGADRFGGLALERGAQCRRVQVTVHTTKLLAGLGYPGRAPPSAICPSRQRLTLPACSRQTETIDSIQFVERSVRASVGGTPRRRTVRVSSRPSRRLAAAPGWVRSSFFGQGEQGCLGLQR
jgi:hypothetical protein